MNRYCAILLRFLLICYYPGDDFCSLILLDSPRSNVLSYLRDQLTLLLHVSLVLSMRLASHNRSEELLFFRELWVRLEINLRLLDWGLRLGQSWKLFYAVRFGKRTELGGL